VQVRDAKNPLIAPIQRARGAQAKRGTIQNYVVHASFLRLRDQSFKPRLSEQFGSFLRN